MELVILSGLPGSGKSTWFRQNHAATHTLVSKDLMSPSNRRKDERQRELIVEALRAGRSVVVDNTHPTRQARAALIALGHSLGARVIGVHFTTPTHECVARNERREGRARVPKVAIFTVARRMETPSLEEGFDELHLLSA